MKNLRFSIYAGISAASAGFSVLNVVDAVAVVPIEHVPTMGEIAATAGGISVFAGLNAIRHVAAEIADHLLLKRPPGVRFSHEGKVSTLIK